MKDQENLAVDWRYHHFEGGMMVQYSICLNSNVSCQCGDSSYTPAKILSGFSLSQNLHF